MRKTSWGVLIAMAWMGTAALAAEPQPEFAFRVQKQEAILIVNKDGSLKWNAPKDEVANRLLGAIHDRDGEIVKLNGQLADSAKALKDQSDALAGNLAKADAVSAHAADLEKQLAGLKEEIAKVAKERDDLFVRLGAAQIQLAKQPQLHKARAAR